MKVIKDTYKNLKDPQMNNLELVLTNSLYYPKWPTDSTYSHQNAIDIFHRTGENYPPNHVSSRRPQIAYSGLIKKN